MTTKDAIRVLLGDARRFPILTYHDLKNLFRHDKAAAFAKGLRHLVEIGLLERVSKSIYLNCAATLRSEDAIGQLVRYLRAGHMSYLSYESALAEHGSINQVPTVSTFATTGSKGVYRTKYGTIDFTHTTRSIDEIHRETRYHGHEDIFVASPHLAKDDLRRARPHMSHLIIDEYHDYALEEWEASA